MSTRSNIIVQRTDGTFASIYCHSDGYLSHNGRLLFEHWNDQVKAESLIALGDLSVLGEVVGEKHDFDWLGKIFARCSDYAAAERDLEYIRLRPMCRAYGRDRGEAGTEATTGPDLKSVWPPKDSWAEYIYVWKDGQWFVSTSTMGRLKPLEKALKSKAAA